MFNIVSLGPELPEAQRRHLLRETRALFREYAAELGVDLEFQEFKRELEGLPGDYAPPGGRLFVAWPGPAPRPGGQRPGPGGEAAGCVALRPLGGEACELKRLYVRPAFRSHGLGRRLCQRLLQEAAAMGYRRLRLDTLERLREALGLYRALGFREIPSYRYNPLPGALFLERPLP